MIAFVRSHINMKTMKKECRKILVTLIGLVWSLSVHIPLSYCVRSLMLSRLGHSKSCMKMV